MPKQLALSAQNSALSFSIVAEHAVDFRHVGEGLRLGLRRAAGHDDVRIRALAPEPADSLARLPHRFGRHRAGVDDDCVLQPAARPRARITSNS